MKTLKLKSLNLKKVKRNGQRVVSHPDIKPWDNNRNYLVRVTFLDNTTKTFTSHAHSSQMYGLGFTDSTYRGDDFPNRDYPLNGRSYSSSVRKNNYRNNFTLKVWEIDEKR